LQTREQSKYKKLKHIKTLFALCEWRWDVVEGADVIHALVRARASADGTPEQTEDAVTKTIETKNERSLLQQCTEPDNAAI